MEGSLVLARLPQATGPAKSRPALVLRQMRPFGDLLPCGVSSQLHQAVPGFDEPLPRTHPDFVRSGLHVDSLLRLGYLTVLPRTYITGTLGTVSADLHRQLLQRLSDFLRP